MKRRNWFENPPKLRFRCIRCGICCGDTPQKTRHILLLKEEAEEIALTIVKPVSYFSSKVDGALPYRFEMKKNLEDGKCVFLKENRCTAYAVRPLICRFYPFGLKVEQNRHRVFYFANECPGIGKGRIVSENDFRRLLRDADSRTLLEQ